MLTGSLAGLVQDALTTGVIGIGGLAKTVVGFLSGITLFDDLPNQDCKDDTYHYCSE